MHRGMSKPYLSIETYDAPPANPHASPGLLENQQVVAVQAS